MARTQRIQHRGVELEFTVPNLVNHFRIDTFAIKEPETLEWIDALPRGSVLWDVGANIGLYSCYAAKARDCNVYAFEPSVFNLELLARNIFLNRLESRINIVPLALNTKIGTDFFSMTTTEWGGAFSTYGQPYGHDGQSLEKVFEFRTIGISMDDAAQLFSIPAPEHIKIDVDGIEHLILKGGGKLLHGVTSVLIEINDDFEEQSFQAAHFLTNAGLVLKEKRRSEIFQDTIYQASYNQTWVRP
ncbi:MAG TPA: FkbM family methyltransferase [Pyrinomonadaceae bacterium]|jgi:FkbM family methyltransferase|nr:FkbM family methyltransferase [Pyrinomonadaceae bacterium]